MLESHRYMIDGIRGSFLTNVRTTEDLPAVLQFWMAHMARDLLRLGVYFHAAALITQVPGGARYRWARYDDNDKNLPDENEDPHYRIGQADDNTAFSVLAECLQRLGAPGLVNQIPRRRDYKRVKLSNEWNAYLERQAKIKHGLLNVVAQCLDRLVVKPGMEEIDAEPRPTWFQHWWSRMLQA